MKFVLAAVFAALLAVPAAAGTKIDDPVKFVTGIYAKLHATENTNTAYSEPTDIYTARLQALMALESKEAGGEVGRLDFDFWVNAQDWQLKNVRVSGTPVESRTDREVVTAKFTNGDRKQTILFYFEKGKDGWKIDDVQSAGSDGWTLSLICKYGWQDGK